MLTVDPEQFARAAEALMIAARSCTDANGLKVYADTPRRPGGMASEDHDPVVMVDGLVDWQRIRAITLGAIVALVNGAAVPGDEHHFDGNALNLGAAMRAQGEPPLIDIHKKR